jgi:hypothetical protein
VHCFHINEVFANHSEEDKIYPLTTEKIAGAQQADASLKHLFKRNAVIDQGLEIELIERTLHASAKMVGKLFLSHSKCVQLNGTTISYSTLDTRVSKRR